MADQLGFVVVGSSYWGMNYVRLLSQLPESNLLAVCDHSETRLNDVSRQFPNLKLYKDVKDVLKLDGVDAVVVSTNPSSHYEVANQFLEAGKHVLVEKPLTKIALDSQKLIDVAYTKKLVLMVGHIFLYNPGIEKVKNYINEGKVGHIHYLYARRTNLGPIREDVNALWDLAPHDISIFNHLLDTTPQWVSAVGTCFLRSNCEDAGFIVLGYPGGIIGQVHVSWADPHKEREIVVVGSNMRIAFNDISFQEKVRVFEKGVVATQKEPSSFGEFQLSIRDGDIIIPHISIDEPLKKQVKHFIQCIRENKKPLTDGKNGLEVVRVMEAIDASLEQNGAPISL